MLSEMFSEYRLYFSEGYLLNLSVTEIICLFSWGSQKKTGKMTNDLISVVSPQLPEHRASKAHNLISSLLH
jgi:hypothetical protein